AWGPLKFCVHGTSEWTILTGDSMVAVANLPVMEKAPIGVDAVSSGSRPLWGMPPRPAETSVTYTGRVPSKATSQPSSTLTAIQVARPCGARPVVSGSPTGAPQGVWVLGVGITAPP